jgi:2-keto-4-pentenoate hydratase
MPAFELIDDRNADYEGFDAHSLIADNTWNAGVILGDAIPNWQSIDWVTQPVRLDYNGKIETAVTGDAMGDPFAALAVVANNLVDRGLSLKPGGHRDHRLYASNAFCRGRRPCDVPD